MWKDAIAVVTGASSGIGRALACELHRRGAVVYVAGRSESKLAALAAECGPRLIPVILDVTDEAAVRALIGRVASEAGRLDYMFNNAGVLLGGDFENMTAAAWKTIVDINIWGTVHGTQHAYSLMVKQGHGHIINTASSAGVMPVSRSVAYTATKYAVVGLSLALREAGRKHGVRVSCTVPGLVDTPIFERAVNLAGYDYDAEMRALPLRKLTPEEAALATLDGVEANRQLIVYPLYNQLLYAMMRAFPGVTSWLINLDLHKSGFARAKSKKESH